MPPLDSDEVLRAEANTIHADRPAIPDSFKGAELYRALHGRNATALCLSGGGIRSASFALGVIEALAVHPRPVSTKEEGDKQALSEKTSYLSKFDYLSTVSGGGYIGSWLSAWIKRCRIKDVRAGLRPERGKQPSDDEPQQIHFLRRFSNYLTPKLGWLGADMWTVITIYIRNVVLN